VGYTRGTILDGGVLPAAVASAISLSRLAIASLLAYISAAVYKITF